MRKVERIFDTKMGVRERNHKQEGWDLAVMRTRSGYAESLEKEKTPLRFSIIDRKRYIKKAKKKKFDLKRSREHFCDLEEISLKKGNPFSDFAQISFKQY